MNPFLPCDTQTKVKDSSTLFSSLKGLEKIRPNDMGGGTIIKPQGVNVLVVMVAGRFHQLKMRKMKRKLMMMLN